MTTRKSFESLFDNYYSGIWPSIRSADFLFKMFYRQVEIFRSFFTLCVRCTIKSITFTIVTCIYKFARKFMHIANLFSQFCPHHHWTPCKCKDASCYYARFVFSKTQKCMLLDVCLIWQTFVLHKFRPNSAQTCITFF